MNIGFNPIVAATPMSSNTLLKKAAQQFETAYLQGMLRSTRCFRAEKEHSQVSHYREIQEQQLAFHLSESGGIGIREMIVRIHQASC